jgi:hypothetical protein
MEMPHSQGFPGTMVKLVSHATLSYYLICSSIQSLIYKYLNTKIRSSLFVDRQHGRAMVSIGDPIKDD